MKKEIVLTVNEKEKFHIRLDFNSIIDPQVDFDCPLTSSQIEYYLKVKSAKVEPSWGQWKTSEKVDSSNLENIGKSEF